MGVGIGFDPGVVGFDSGVAFDSADWRVTSGSAGGRPRFSSAGWRPGSELPARSFDDGLL